MIPTLPELFEEASKYEPTLSLIGDALEVLSVTIVYKPMPGDYEYIKNRLGEEFIRALVTTLRYWNQHPDDFYSILQKAYFEISGEEVSVEDIVSMFNITDFYRAIVFSHIATEEEYKTFVSTYLHETSYSVPQYLDELRQALENKDYSAVCLLAYNISNVFLYPIYHNITLDEKTAESVLPLWNAVRDIFFLLMKTSKRIDEKAENCPVFEVSHSFDDFLKFVILKVDEYFSIYR